MIDVDYQPLDVVVHPEEALNDSVLLFADSADGNIACRMKRKASPQTSIPAR